MKSQVPHPINLGFVAAPTGDPNIWTDRIFDSLAAARPNRLLGKRGERAAPSVAPRYSSIIMVPSITQLCWGSGQTMIDEIFILKRMK